MRVTNCKHEDGFAFGEEQARVRAARVGHVVHGAVLFPVQPALPGLDVWGWFRCGEARQGKSQTAGFLFNRLFQVHV